jgi:hypothetical protein
MSPSASSSESSSLSPSSSESPSLSPSSSESPSLSPSSSNSPSESSSVSPSSSPSVGFQGYTREDIGTLPTNDADLDTDYTEQDYIDVSTKNDVRVCQSGDSSSFIIHEFKDFIGDQNTCNLECELRSTLAPSSSTVYLQVYNRNTTTWDTVDFDDSSAADTDFVLETFMSDLTNYKDGNSVISSRIYQEVL